MSTIPNSIIIQHDQVMMYKIFILLLCCALLTSCRPPYKRGEKPNNEDVVGVYIPTSATLRRLKKEGYQLKKEIFIELQEHGNFTIKNMPDMWMTDWAEPKGGFDSGSGTWEVNKSYSVWVISIAFDTMDAQSTNDLLNEYIYNVVHITNSKPPYGLAIALMAGDHGHLWFKKVIAR